MTIVICDDMAEHLANLESAVNNCKQLQEQPVELIQFKGGRECLEAIQGGLYPDLIIIDVRMPDIGGVDVINMLPRNSDAAVIFVTAYGDTWPETRRHVASGFLHKPYTQKTFDATINVMQFRKAAIYDFEYRYMSSKSSSTSKEYRRDHIKCNRIIAFSAQNHSIEMRTTDFVRNITGTKLSDIEHELKEYGFFLCNRSCLINLRFYHDRSNTEAFLKVGMDLYNYALSREKVSSLEDAVMSYRVGGQYAF